MTRADYIKCVAQTHEDSKHLSYCGRQITAEFCFMGIDHLANVREYQGRLLPCGKCLKKIIEIIKNRD